MATQKPVCQQTTSWIKAKHGKSCFAPFTGQDWSVWHAYSCCFYPPLHVKVAERVHEELFLLFMSHTAISAVSSSNERSSGKYTSINASI